MTKPSSLLPESTVVSNTFPEFPRSGRTELLFYQCIYCVLRWHFYLFLSLCWTALQPYRLSHINSINPRTNPWIFWKKYWELEVLKTFIFLSWTFWILNFLFCFIPMTISHKFCVGLNRTQFLWLWWFTTKTDPHQTLIPAVYNLPLDASNWQIEAA